MKNALFEESGTAAGVDPQATPQATDPEEGKEVLERLRRFEQQVSTRNKSIAERQEKEDKARKDNWRHVNSRSLAEPAIHLNEGVADDSPDERERRCDDERVAREARQKWCDWHERQCGSSGSQTHETRAEGPASGVAAQQTEKDKEAETARLALEASWNRDGLKGLLELWEDGFSVAWPKGCDPVTAKRLLKEEGKT